MHIYVCIYLFIYIYLCVRGRIVHACVQTKTIINTINIYRYHYGVLSGHTRQSFKHQHSCHVYTKYLFLVAM